MRLLLASFVRNTQRTGMGRWSHAMAAALRERGHAPTVWFEDDFPGTAGLGRLAVLVFPLTLAARLLRHRARFDAVIIHEPSGFWYGLLARAARRLPPLILMCHNVEARVYRDLLAFASRGCAAVRPGTRLTTPLFRLWQSRGAIRLADHVVCLSEHDRDHLIAAGIPAERVTRLVNGAPRPAARTLVASPRVLFVGGWVDVKGRRVLPALWRRVREHLPAARLTLVGTGVPDHVLRRAFDPAVRDSLDILEGMLGEAELTRLYAEHAALVAPSLTEGSPLVVLEAMAAGLPVAAAAVGGIPDVIRDGEHGLLFPPCDPEAGAAAVRRLLDDPARAASLAANAQARARHCTWHAAAEGLAAAVRYAIATR